MVSIYIVGYGASDEETQVMILETLQPVKGLERVQIEFREFEECLENTYGGFLVKTPSRIKPKALAVIKELVG